MKEGGDVPANPPGCLGANSVKSQTESPMASQRSEVLLCWPTSSAVMMRVIVEKGGEEWVAVAAVNCVLELSIDELKTEREYGEIPRCIGKIKK